MKRIEFLYPWTTYTYGITGGTKEFLVHLFTRQHTNPAASQPTSQKSGGYCASGKLKTDRGGNQGICS